MSKKLIIAGLMLGLVFSCFVGVGNLYCDTVQEHFDRGNDYDAKGDYYQAIAEFKKVLQLRPGTFEIYTNIGLSYNGLKKYQEAISNFQKALQINSNDYVAHDGMGVSYHYLGDYQQSANCYKKAIRAKPDYALAHESLARAYGWMYQYEEAKKSFQKAKELYQAQGNYTKAREMEDTINKLSEFQEYENEEYWD